MNTLKALTLDGLKSFYIKYIKPIKNAAYCTVVNNGTTTTSNTVLDGRMGKTLADKDANLQSQIDTLNSTLAKPVLLWNGLKGNGSYIYLNQRVDNFSRLTFVYKRNDGFFYNATFLVSTLLKTTPTSGVQQMFMTGCDTTIYVLPENHTTIGAFMTSNLQINEIYGHKN